MHTKTCDWGRSWGAIRVFGVHPWSEILLQFGVRKLGHWFDFDHEFSRMNTNPDGGLVAMELGLLV